MNDTIDSLDENICKLLIDKLVKKAFGKDAVAEIRDEDILQKFVIRFSKSSSYYYMFGFGYAGSGESMHFSNVLESLDKPTWKNILKKCLNIVARGGYVSYLHDNAKHMLDNGMTLEQLLVENDLTSIAA